MMTRGVTGQGRVRRTSRDLWGLLLIGGLGLGCSSGDSGSPTAPADSTSTVTSGANTSATMAAIGDPAPLAGAGGGAANPADPASGAPSAPAAPTAPAGTPGDNEPAADPAGAPAAPPVAAPGDPAAAPPTTAAPTPAASGPPAAAPPLPDGDPNGDPGGATVSIPDTKCGPAAGLDAFVAAIGIPGPGTPNVKIGGRDVVLSYPCNKKEGAHVTFILNLHGTMPDDGFKLYQHGYFAAHKLVDSHSLIVATPMSVVAQWGNGDGGVDVPHLYEVVDWVYSKFSKYKITGMWVGGHSWGSMFAKGFVCDEMFVDKARGIIGMSGGATGVGGVGSLFGGGGGGSNNCAARLSQIHTVGDAEGGEAGVPDQTAAATAHGCDGRLAPRDIGNNQMLYEWPNCDPGWVHFNFVMGAHEHITAIDPPVVEHIVDAIKSTESM